MRIAQISPLAESVPPKKYGGTERVVSALTEGLVRRGHQVTLFASGDSITLAKLISVYPKALREAKVEELYGINFWQLLNIGLAYQMQDQFDIIHDHTGHTGLPTANIASVPVVTTLHGAFTTNNRKLYETLGKRINFVAISKSQYLTLTKLNYAGVVYNGLDMKHYPFSNIDRGYLLYVGRISIEKGLHIAIQVAQFLNLPLIIAAKLDVKDVQYFREYIEPRLSDQIRWIGEVDTIERNKLMSRALCLLHPVTWKEPFGLTMIESMACGAPVVAFNIGSIPEVVLDGKTGYIVEDIEEMIEAVIRIKRIDRKYCRKYALENFNDEIMVDRYETIYHQIVAGKTKQLEQNLPLNYLK